MFWLTQVSSLYCLCVCHVAPGQSISRAIPPCPPHLSPPGKETLPAIQQEEHYSSLPCIGHWEASAGQGKPVKLQMLVWLRVCIFFHCE